MAEQEADPGASPQVAVFLPLEPGDPTHLGDYVLAARLGAGGMGTVYLAHTLAGRPVAVKAIRPELADNPDFRRRFRREVAAARRVHGLYTAPVVDSEIDATPLWLATAFVQGPTLSAAVSRHGTLPLPSVLLLAAGVAEALHAVHGEGIVHRDLKASNVLLAADGPRVIDFGIAWAVDTTALTHTGATVGTPSFMSPEQALDREIGPATDIFSLGQLVTYAAKGTPAFGEGQSYGVLYRIVHEEPDLTDVPEALLPLLNRCLDKDPGKRPSPTEVIGLCRAASEGGMLRRTGNWLPEAVTADITRHQDIPHQRSAGRGLTGARDSRGGGDTDAGTGPGTVTAAGAEDTSGAAVQARTAHGPRGDTTVSGPRYAPFRPPFPAPAPSARRADAVGADLAPTESSAKRSTAAGTGHAPTQPSVQAPPESISVAPSESRTPTPTEPPAPAARDADRSDGDRSAAARAPRRSNDRPQPPRKTIPRRALLTLGATALAGAAGTTAVIALRKDSDPKGSEAATPKKITVSSTARLTAHKGNVNDVAFSPDGAIFATASDDKSVILWDAKTARPTGSLTGHQEGVNHVCFSPDGATIVTREDDRSGTLWNAKTRRSIKQLTFRNSSVSVARFSPNSEHVATAGDGTTVLLWDVAAPDSPHSLTGHTDFVLDLSFRPTGDLLATASFDGTVILWDVETRQSAARLRGHDDTVTSVAFSPDGGILATGSADGTVLLWNAESRKSTRLLNGHRSDVYLLVFSPDGRTLATVSHDDQVLLWDMETRKRTASLAGHDSFVSALEFTRDSKTLVTSGGDGRILLWDVTTRQHAKPLTGHTRSVLDATLSPDGRTLVTASKDKTVRLWKATGNTRISAARINA